MKPNLVKQQGLVRFLNRVSITECPICGEFWNVGYIKIYGKCASCVDRDQAELFHQDTEFDFNFNMELDSNLVAA